MKTTNEMAAEYLKIDLKDVVRMSFDSLKGEEWFAEFDGPRFISIANNGGIRPLSRSEVDNRILTEAENESIRNTCEHCFKETEVKDFWLAAEGRHKRLCNACIDEINAFLA